MTDTANGVTVDDLLAEIAPRIVSVRILLRQDLNDRHAELEAQLQREVAADARENRDPVAPDIAQQILDLEADIEAAKREFKFKAIGHRAWADLMAAHPPTKEQRQQNPRLDHDPQEFPRHAIAASCISPKVTLAQVIQFEDMLDESRWMQLYGACLDANAGAGSGPKSVLAGAIARANAELGAPPPALEFPGLDSLDG